MAQTIAMQRGTSTVAHTAQTTLFTQSGGLATRVIFNGLAGHNPAQTSSQVVISVQPSGGAPYVLGYGVSAYADWEFKPNTNTYGVVASGTSLWPDSFLYLSNTASTYVADQNGSTLNVVGPSTSNYGFGIPQNFWIGPGDAVRMRFWQQAGNTCTFGWSFTTITES